MKILGTFVSSTLFVFYPGNTVTKIAVATVNIGALLAAHQHVGNFWKDKAKVPLPGVGDYNDAISSTKETRLNMTYLAASWGAVVLLSLV